MAVEAKKGESSVDPAPSKATVDDPKSEIAGLEAELATLRRNYNVLDTAHKRAQKKIAVVEEENRSLKKGETPKDAKTLTEGSATNVPPAVGAGPSTEAPALGAEL